MDDLRIPADSVDLREGPDLHPALSPFLPLIGVWRGVGKGGYPTLASDFDYGQQVRFAHDGRPFLCYEARSWLLSAEGEVIRPAAREVGWWRPGQDGEFEVLLAYPTGIVEVYLGVQKSVTQWEMSTDVVARTPTAKEVTANHRLYGVVEGDLLYAVDMAAVGQPLQPHLSARLSRVAG
ncbi:MAG TPA: FABP family protein [Mycobacteriales bacterium]|nr:FABP family protein [Mycobacteriales bacterium]